MNKDALHKETHFEAYITRKLAMLAASGWQVSNDNTGFDPNSALYMQDFIAYQEAIAPDKIEKMKKNMGANWQKNLELSLVKSLENYGTVMTLREGFQTVSYTHLDVYKRQVMC